MDNCWSRTTGYPGILFPRKLLWIARCRESKVSPYFIRVPETASIPRNPRRIPETLPIQLKVREIINIQLVRNASSQNSWNFLYGNTDCFTDYKFFVTHASVGWEHMSPLDKGEGDNSLTIAFYRNWEFWIWSLLYIGILVFFIIVASSTDVLKAIHDGPYSLSNTQGLFWTFLIIGAFIYTLLLTDISMSFNTSILGMLGISLGTTGVATAIDFNKINSNRAYMKRRQSFFKDLLTDGDSYSVQRVQTFAWNVILGLYFIFYTIKNKTMPEFSTAVLLLAGFSSTSYLSGKLSENTAASVAAQTAQAAVKATEPPQPIQVPKT